MNGKAAIARSLLYGFANLLHPRMLWLMVWPMLIAVVPRSRAGRGYFLLVLLFVPLV